MFFLELLSKKKIGRSRGQFKIFWTFLYTKNFIGPQKKVRTRWAPSYVSIKTYIHPTLLWDSQVFPVPGLTDSIRRKGGREEHGVDPWRLHVCTRGLDEHKRMDMDDVPQNKTQHQRNLTLLEPRVQVPHCVSRLVVSETLDMVPLHRNLMW